MKPIPFNTDMVRAIQADLKTVTRRVVKPHSPKACGFYVTYRKSDGAFMGVYDYDEHEMMFDSPQAQPAYPGDILYAPQAWKCIGIFGELGYEVEFQDGQRVKFKFESRERAKKWAKYRDKPSNHWQSPYFMPREAARIFLRVTDVRVERLQDITETQILEDEGVQVDFPQPKPTYLSLAYAETRLKPIIRKAFAELWNSTIKKADRALYGWDANPWVWTIEFERISREEAIR